MAQNYFHIYNTNLSANLKETSLQMTQKKDEALAACSDSGQEALMKAIWTLEANMLHRLRRMESRVKSQDLTIADLCNKMQIMKADITVK